MMPLERKAAFRAAVTLHEMTMTEAAKRLGISYNHMVLVLAGERVASRALQDRMAAFVGRPREELFPLVSPA